MKAYFFLLSISALILIVNSSGCYSSYQASGIIADTSKSSLNYSNPAKAFLINDNIILFRNGFTRIGDRIAGSYDMYDYKGVFLGSGSNVALDSIIAITNYKETTSEGVGIATGLSILLGVPLTATAIYCLICPKCCFGSCPTVYTASDSGYLLQAKLFSKCISKQL